MKILPKESVRIPALFCRNFLLLLLVALNLNLIAQTTCPAAENVAVSTITSNSVRINYNLSASISSAAIEYSTSSTSNWKSVPISKTATYWDLTNLTPATKYYYHIKSVCENAGINISPVFSTTRDFTTYPVATCPAASNLSVSEITAASARINYSLSPNIGSATLEVSSTNNSSIRSINIEVKSTYYDLKDLTASTTYYYKIKTICTNTPGVYSPVYTNISTFKTIALPVCAAASNLSVGSITAVSATINYSLPKDLSSAALEIRPSTSTAYNSISLSLTSTSYLRNELTALTKYYIRIKTVCKNGVTNYAESSFTTLAAPVCSAASNVSVSNISAKGALINYKLPAEIKSATLEITSANSNTVTGSNQVWQSITITNNSSSYQFTNLLPLTRYYARIKTVCSNGSDNTSSVVYFTTLALPGCTAATDLSVTEITSVSAKINYILHGEIKSATLLIRPSTSTAYLSIVIPVPSAYFVRNELAAQTKYYYKISTVCSDGTIVTTSEASFTTIAAPTCVPATTLSAGSISSVGAKISYNLPKEIIGATLEIFAANTTSPAGSTANWQSFKLTLGTTAYELKGLTPQTLYYFRIKTECTNGSSIYSEVYKFTTLATPTCTAATNLSVSNIYSASVRINFTLPQGIVSAAVEILPPGTITWLSYGITNLSSTYFDRRELSPLTRYSYRIKTVCKDGTVTYTSPGYFTTIAETSCIPATNSVSNVTATGAKINFTLPKNSSSAVLEINSSNYPNWQPITLSLTSTVYELTHLYSATRYAFRIKTVCVNGTGTDQIMYSTEGSFYTLSASTCSAATNVTYSIVSNTSAHIYFTLPKNIFSAIVEITTPNHTDVWSSFAINDLSSAYYNLEGLTAGTQYYFRIKTVCSDNPGSNSINYTPAATFTTSNNKDAAIGLAVPTTQSPGDLGVSCYPNPASTNISVTITGVSSELVDLMISNIYGLIVFQGKYSENTVQKIDVQSYPRGIYVIRVSQSGQTNSIKVALK